MTTILRRGLRCFGSGSDNFVLIFIHDLESWTESRLWEFLSKKISNCNNIIQGIVKKHYVNMENYFIIRVNYKNHTDFIKVLILITSHLPIKNKVYWKIKSNIRSYSKTIRSSSLTPISEDFLYTNPSSSAKFFNLCACWNINGWNTNKRDGLTYFNSIFRPICVCLQEVGNSSFLNSFSNQYPFLNHYKSVLRRADKKVPGMRGLYIGVHSSCQYSSDPFEYKYIISVNINSFWGVRCSIGNTYIPSLKHSNSRNTAISDLTKWLKDHQNNPSILVGDFNMSKEKLLAHISSTSQYWSIMDMKGHEFTWSSGGKNSCIDFIIVNDKMKGYLNIASVCNTFNDISDHFPLILSCKKESPDGFTTPTPEKQVKWSNRVCRSKSETIFSHNDFAILADEFEHNDNLNSNTMVNKFLDTANKVGKEIQAIVPTNLEGSAFHCPNHIKRLSHQKHLLYHRIKNFKLESDMSNLQIFLDLNKEYAEFSDLINRLKKVLRTIQFKKNIHVISEYFLNNDPQRGWAGLKKISKPSYSLSQSSSYIKDKNGNFLVSQEEQLNRFAEHYRDLASDVTNHSLDEDYWNKTLDNLPTSSEPWNINQPISMEEIESTILLMKNNKAPGPDGIPAEFYKAFFKNSSSGQSDSNSEETPYSDCAKCLLLLFNKIWNGDFPSDWNSATIVSIPKKGDLSDCSNYRGISLINVGLKILSKIVTNRISQYAITNNKIRPEQFGFRNKEECISLYISVREICQRRKIQGKFTYLAFLDLKKAYDSVPIFNILTKLYKIGIRGKCFQFLKNLYLTSKARAKYNCNLSHEFPIHRGVRQGCPLSPILFNIFINDVLDNCDKFGVNVEGKKCCGGLFADDIVLIAPSVSCMKLLLKSVHEWGINNEMKFGINKCATLIVKPLKLRSSQNFTDKTFHLGIHPLPKTKQYTYLGIPFDESLELKPIISYMNSKINFVVNSFFHFLTNQNVPFYFKTRILISYVLSTVLYYAPLFGSNKSHTKKAQTALNKGMFWSFGFKKKSSNTSIYNMSKELSIPPIACFCANAQIRCFNKWSNSSCIIAHLVNNIPTLSHYSWSKKSRRLSEVTHKDKTPEEIKKLYWENEFFKLMKANRSVKYKKYKFGFKKLIYRLSHQYSQFSKGFFWIGRIKCGYQFDVNQYIKSNMVSAECPSCCPCCGETNSVPSFTHWVMSCSKFNEFREHFIRFVDDIFINFSLIVHEKSLNIPDNSENDFEDNLNFYVLCLLLGGNAIFEILHISSGERRRFINNIFQNVSRESSFPYSYVVGLAEFLTIVMPIVIRDFYSMIDLYSTRPTVARSVDVETIRQRINNSDTNSNDNISQGVIIDEWEELEVLSPSLLS